VAAHQPFLDITPLDLDNVWVVANMREEQMARGRVGQPVTISVDGIPERTFDGWVESVSGGTGAVFSLFPPDDATGNFVRVVQRLPVRVRFSDGRGGRWLRCILGGALRPRWPVAWRRLLEENRCIRSFVWVSSIPEVAAAARGPFIWERPAKMSSSGGSSVERSILRCIRPCRGRRPVERRIR
jgi:hypothetical protein